MGRPRKRLEMSTEGQHYVTRFWHPLQSRTVRCVLGSVEEGALAGQNLTKLNELFLDPAKWENPPEGLPECVRDAWGAGVTMDRKGIVRRGSKKLKTDSEEVAVLRAELDSALAVIRRQDARIRELTRVAEHWKGKRIRQGACPTLGEAREHWLSLLTGKDPGHRKNIVNDTKRFMEHFKAGTPVDDLAGREREIAAWLDGLGVSPSRRQQVRIYALKMLEDEGAPIDRKAVPAAKLHQIRAARKPIAWLTKPQAEAVAKVLPDYWRAVFKVQVGIGLRPEEIPTLRRECFAADLSTVTLRPLKQSGNGTRKGSERMDLTLKRGPRTIPIPNSVQKIVKARLKTSDLCFPDPRKRAKGQAWQSGDVFSQQYRTELKAASTKAKAPFKVTCRTGRSTCGSLLLRAGLSTEQVAAVLGNSPAMVREHYAAILPSEVDPTPAALR